VTKLITDEHERCCPTVRITKAVLDDFKSVKHGELEFDCGKHFVPYGTKSDILGIYGQNGSGKTSFIEALYILKGIFMGKRVPNAYSECVAKTAKCARMEFTLDLQYPDGKIRKAVYACSLSQEEIKESEIKYPEGVDPEDVDMEKSRVKIFNESLSIGGDIAGKKTRLQTIVDTGTGNPFGPASKLKQLVGDDQENIVSLEVNKRLASERSCSFIFMRETLKIFKKICPDSPYVEVLDALRDYAWLYLYVIDTKSAGLIRLNLGMPFYTREGMIHLNSYKPSAFPDSMLQNLRNAFSDVDTVMQQLVPGLAIQMKELSETTLKDGRKGHFIDVVSVRDGVELPLRDESDGVRKIISEICLIVAAYNDPSVTVAIDEFDAGIFEYLLGEILQIIEESGKGQFIFTSHNLRPLEVINKRFLYFTTTNPDNRYIHLKNIGKTNNLRNTYFREIILGEQDEEIYKATQKFKIVEALDKVGMEEEKRHHHSDKRESTGREVRN
jgi:AAA15 family ATPase/GTPase